LFDQCQLLVLAVSFKDLAQIILGRRSVGAVDRRKPITLRNEIIIVVANAVDPGPSAKAPAITASSKRLLAATAKMGPASNATLWKTYLTPG